MGKRAQLINALTELKNASMLFKSNPTILDKYKILFCDADCKTLDTSFLEDCCNTYFSMGITTEELLKIIPDVCQQLNLKYTPVLLQDASNQTVQTHYEIQLW